MHAISISLAGKTVTVRDPDIHLAREEAERVADKMVAAQGPDYVAGRDGVPAIVESNDDVDPTRPTEPAPAIVPDVPEPLTPSRRVMRRVGQTEDHITVDGKRVVLALQPWETSIDWVPSTIPVFTFPRRLGGTTPVRSGSYVSVLREGFEGAPFGVASETYRPIDHHETVSDVAASTEGRATFEGALIDGHGYHIVHAFRLAAEVPERVAEIAKAHKVEIGDYPTNPSVRGLPLVSRLTLVHDHTGDGSLRASVVCYLGDDIVVGSACYTRRIHVGAGEKDVGVGDRARWLAVVDAMLDTASLQHGAIGALLLKASETAMTDEVADLFAKRGIPVARAKVSRKEREAAAERGEPEPKGEILAKTALDVVIAYYKHRGEGRSRGLSWGVWSRRLEGGALAALEEICGVSLPKQLFRRG